MRNQWYGDRWDVVKWGTVLHLAREHRLRLILQIAYFRPDQEILHLKSGCRKIDIGGDVFRHFRHFRDIHHIQALARRARIKIEVFDRPFMASSRKDYTSKILRRIRDLADPPAVVLLDPDTGLSRKRYSNEHVTPDEVAAIWAELRPQDWLVLYQHNARKKDWFKRQRNAFTNACNGANVTPFVPSNGARNVALFAACRMVNPA